MMLSYPLCDQTVTLYKKLPDAVERRVVQGCFYRYEDCLTEGLQGLGFTRKFTLVLPGDTKVSPGERVLEGVGPKLELQQWEQFIPACVPGLSEAQYAAPQKWQGKICHWEAGRR